MSLRWIKSKPKVAGINRRGSAALLAALLILCTAQLLPQADAANSPGDPLQQIHDGIDQVIAVFQKEGVTLSARREELRRLAERHFDFNDMARSVLGYHWRSLSAQQRSDFVPLFRTFIENAFLSKLQEYTVKRIQQEAPAAKITYLRETFDSPEYAQVFTDVKVSEQKDPLHVNYLMHRIDDSWRVYDISIDAISIIGNYRNQFDRVINNQGYDELLAVMLAKIKGFRELMEHPAESPVA